MVLVFKLLDAPCSVATVHLYGASISYLVIMHCIMQHLHLLSFAEDLTFSKV